MRSLVLAFSCVTVLAWSSAGLLSAEQRADQSRASALIVGQILDADSGKGVANVVVTIGGPTVAMGVGELIDSNVVPAPTGAVKRVLTSADGRFLFRDLAKGRYLVAMTAPGYVPGAYGQTRPLGPSVTIDLADGQKLNDLKIRAWKLGAISGTVTDERGEPVVGASVRYYRRVIAGGKTRFSANTYVYTDDRGMYRIASLTPGDYVIGMTTDQQTSPLSAVTAGRSSGPNATPESRLLSASGARPTGDGFRVGDWVLQQNSSGNDAARPAPSPDGRMMAYASVFYPNAPTASQAALISLKSGEDRQGIDLSLRLLRALRISGTVIGPNGPAANLGITLLPTAFADLQSEGTAEAARTISDSAGRYAFLGVPEGQYSIRIRMYPQPIAGGAPAPATIDAAPAVGVGRGAAIPPPPPLESTLWAVVPVTVKDTDVAGLDIPLKVGLRVTGRVEFAGAKPPPPIDQLQRMTIAVQGTEGHTSSPIAAQGRVLPDLTFRTSGYPACRCIVSATTVPAGWSIKSIVSGGRDISVEPFDLADGDITDAVITLTDQTSGVSGTVTGATGADANAEVIIFPADSLAWKEIGVVSRRGRDERTTKAGAFAATGLPAGDYFVVALPSTMVTDWRDPKLLDTLVMQATRVTLRDGENATVALKTAVAR